MSKDSTTNLIFRIAYSLNIPVIGFATLYLLINKYDYECRKLFEASR